MDNMKLLRIEPEAPGWQTALARYYSFLFQSLECYAYWMVSPSRPDNCANQQELALLLATSDAPSLLQSTEYGSSLTAVQWEVVYSCGMRHVTLLHSRFPLAALPSSTLGGSFVTPARRVLGLWLEETASRYGRKLRIYWISSRGQPTRGGCGLVLGLTTLHLKK
jgi:hypothetical protein